jgi:hypothetical protein
VDIVHLSDWLKFALVVWVVVSLLAAPLVGRFLAGALHERADEPQRFAGHESNMSAGRFPQAAAFRRLQVSHS